MPRFSVGGLSMGCLGWLVLIAVFFAVGLLSYACSGGH